jgi:D-glycero-D-manno-heptose 1,7-bisphosphate phosphatase
VSNKALFLDRDGTINIEKNYLFRIEDFEFREGIFDVVKAFYDRGYLIFVVTNQSGIARGFYSEEDFQQLTNWMKVQFGQNGIEITKVYHCPHHPDFTGECVCRKPEPGLILKAIQEYKLTSDECVLIGDSERDIEAGLRAGIRQIFKIKETGRIDLKDVAIY